MTNEETDDERLRNLDPASTLSGIVTAASAGDQSANLDSAWTPVSASVPCTMVESDRAQEL